ncbi:MAG: hypothetical protein ACI4M6_01165 [Christensenellaceae bacterium]
MKISKIDYEICCDVPFCGRLANFAISVGDAGVKQHICKTCAKELKAQLVKIGDKNI